VPPLRFFLVCVFFPVVCIPPGCSPGTVDENQREISKPFTTRHFPINTPAGHSASWHPKSLPHRFPREDAGQ
jgi:hypothetical protein